MADVLVSLRAHGKTRRALARIGSVTKGPTIQAAALAHGLAERAAALVAGELRVLGDEHGPYRGAPRRVVAALVADGLSSCDSKARGTPLFPKAVSVTTGIFNQSNAQGIDDRRMLTRPVQQSCVIDEDHLHGPPHLTAAGSRRRGPSDRLPQGIRDI